MSDYLRTAEGWSPRGRMRIDEKQSKILHGLLTQALAQLETDLLKGLTNLNEARSLSIDLNSMLNEVKRTMEDFGWAL